MVAGQNLNVLLFLAVTTFAAGLAKGFSGFGAALVFMPLASGAIGPVLASPIFLLIDSVSTLPMMRSNWKFADKSELVLIAIGGLIGIPIGIAALLFIEPIIIRWLISLVSIGLVLCLVLGWRYIGRPRSALTIGVGITAGTLQGIAQISGPPLMLFWLGGISSAERIRANALIIFAILTSASVVFYGVAGILSLDAALLALLALPIYALGLFCGSKLFTRASEGLFRHLSYGLIVAAAFISLPVLDPIFGR